MSFEATPNLNCPFCGSPQIDAGSGGTWICCTCNRWFAEGEELNDNTAEKVRLNSTDLLQQLKQYELVDAEVSKCYMDLTGGRVSYPSTCASVVCDLAQEEFERDADTEAKALQNRIDAAVNRLRSLQSRWDGAKLGRWLGEIADILRGEAKT